MNCRRIFKNIFLLLLAGLLWAPAAAQDLIIRGGQLFTATSEQARPNPGLYIRNGRIMALGELPDDTSVPVLSLEKDDFLMPGLIDLHAHYRVVMEGMVGDDTAATPLIYLANGVTSTFPAGEVQPEKMHELRMEIDGGRRAGPRILSSGPYFGTAAPDWERGWGEEEIRRRVDRWAARGVSGFKAKGITAPQLEVLIEQAHRHGLTVTAHLDSGRGSSVNPADAIKMGIDRIEHFLGGACLPDTAGAYASLRKLDAEDPCVGEIIERYKKNGVYFDATLSTYGIIGRVDHPAFRKWTDESRFLTPWMREKFRETTESSLEALFRDVYHAKKAAVRRYYESGGLLTMGTDRPVMRSTLPFLGGFAAHRELQALSEAGIPNYAVLRIATRNSARAIGMGDRLGTIEPGKWADLMIVKDNPLEEISRTRSVHTVIKGGRIYDPAALLRRAENRLGPGGPGDWPRENE